MPKMTTARCRPLLCAVTVAGALALAPAASNAPSWAAGGPAVSPRAHQRPPSVPRYRSKAVCGRPAQPDVASCLALARSGVRRHIGLFAAGADPGGYGPADLRGAYDLPSSTAGSGATVAIVDAYDDPAAEKDLQTYRKQYGLPVCGTADGCFTKVNQEGKQGSYPKANASWAEEESLDVDMVSAICPECHILLVEADNGNLGDLGQAVDEAVKLGAKYVSNSYGNPGEFAGETKFDHFYDHQGVAVTVAAGDLGYGPVYPAASRYVTTVGGTSLQRYASAPRGWVESVWGTPYGTLFGGTGSGCSAYEPKPSWQHDPGCAKRTEADVSAVADPSTGVAVYDSYASQGWGVIGGTSVASPIIASSYALAGPPKAATYPASYPYAAELSGAKGGLNDVTSGANGRCSTAYLCTAETGYDGPTGWGTPEGTSALVYRQSGTVSGTVINAATGRPVAAAQVSVPGLTVTTDSNGGYTLSLPVASYRLSVTDYGFQTQTTSVTVTAKGAITENFKLVPQPRVTVSGSVADGSGQGWPLYAQVTWSDGDGHSGTVFTSPSTGEYSLSLVANSGYTLRVSTPYPGYQPATEKITTEQTALTENVSLAVNPLTCSAPGYHFTQSGSTQPFTGQAGRHPAYLGAMQAFDGAGPPKGWTVSDVNLHYPGYDDTPGWVFDDPGHRGNHTGGTGGFAIVDSAHDGAHHYQDTYLTSPVTSMAADKSPAVVFATDLVPAVNATATAQVSTDAGKTWTTVWSNSGYPGLAGPTEVALPLPQAAGKGDVQVRFGYLGEWSQYWEIDNVFLGNRPCVPQQGGIVTGRVTSTSGAAINGATVISVTNPSQRAVTVATPGDPSINGGFYWLFATATGAQKFTATMSGYTTVRKSATIAAGRAATLNFTLPAAG